VASASTPTRQSSGDPWYSRPAVLLRLLLVLTFAIYLRAVTFDFVYDDHYQIALNPWLESWRQVPSFFTHQLWAFTDSHSPAKYYRPLFMLWLAAISHLTGGAPGWYHLLTIALHIVVTIEAFLLARLLTKDQWTALLAAAFFALDPAKVESVAWISGGSEPLFAVFFFATFIFYLRARSREARRIVTPAALIFFILALFSKEQAVVIPVLIFIYEFCGRDQSHRFRRSLSAVLPFAITVGIFWTWRWHIMHGLSEATANISWQKTLFTQPRAWLWYVEHSLFPFRVALFHSLLIERHFSVARFLVPLVALLLIFGVLAYFTRRHAPAAFLLAWVVLTAAPPIVFILLLQPHDRYLYLPSFPAAVALAWCLRKLIPNPKWQMGVAAAWCALLAVSTAYEVGFWDNDVSVMEHAVSRSPENAYARVMLGKTYSIDGDKVRAAAEFRDALQTDPNNFDAWDSLAMEAYNRGDYAEASADWQHALDLATPDSRSGILFNLGLTNFRSTRLLEAERWTRLAIAADPNSVSYHLNLANILAAENRTAEAQAERALAHHIRK